jgi:acetyl esterase/lipase
MPPTTTPRPSRTFRKYLSGFQSRGAKLYERVPGRRNLRYGKRSRECFDWLSCGKAAAPTFIFIHGGYWQNGVKEDFAFIADGVLMSALERLG